MDEEGPSESRGILNKMANKSHWQNYPHFNIIKASGIHSSQAGFDETIEIEQYAQNSVPLTCQQADPTPSESLAKKITEMEKSRKCTQNGTQTEPEIKYQYAYYGPVSHYPSPIIFNGLNPRVQRLWNDKMINFDRPLHQTVDTCAQQCLKPADRSNILNSYSLYLESAANDNHISEPDNGTIYLPVKFEDERINRNELRVLRQPNSEPVSSPTKIEDNRVNRNELRVMKRPNSEPYIGTVSLLGRFGDDRVNRNELRVLKRPTGWLRSSPISRSHGTVPHPKVNRTHLLRRVNLDPQLAHLLQVEVDYQVRQRIKQTAIHLKEQVRLIQNREARKRYCGKMQSVGCQTTAEGLNNISSVSLEVDAQSSTLALSDCRQREERSNVGATSSDIVLSHRTRETSDKGIGVLINKGRSKPKEIKRNLTFDLTESQNSEEIENDVYEDDFNESLTESQNSEAIENDSYEGDFNVYVNLQTDDATTDIMESQSNTRANAALATTTDRSPHSVSLFLSTSEPKQHMLQPRSTKKVYDDSEPKQHMSHLRPTNDVCDDSEPKQHMSKPRPTKEDHNDSEPKQHMSQPRPTKKVHDDSEPKQYRYQPRPTNKASDAKLQDGRKKEKKLTRSNVVQAKKSTRLNVVREPSHELGVTYTVYDDHSEGFLVSPRVESNELSDHSEFQNAQESIRLSLDLSHSSLQTREKAKDIPVLIKASKALEVSAEVWEENLRGKQADPLAGVGGKLAKSQDHSVTAEEVSSVNGSYHSCVEGSGSSLIEMEVSEEENISEVYQETPRSGRVSYIPSDYNRLESSSISSYTPLNGRESNISESSKMLIEVAESRHALSPSNIDVLKPIKISTSFVPNDFYVDNQYSERNVNSHGSHNAGQAMAMHGVGRTGYDGSRTSLDIGMTWNTVGGEEQDVNDCSISDISARIAALLVPRRVSVAKINTDSVSSYIPSDMGDTMSSLSDMSQD